MDVRDNIALKKIFSIPHAMKAKQKFKQKFNQSVSIPADEPQDDVIMRTVSNNIEGYGKLKLKNTIRSKLMPNRTKTLISDDNISEHSSDLEFCNSHRAYNKPEMKKRASNSIDMRFLPKRKKSKMMPPPVTVEDEQMASISWYSFNKKGSPEMKSPNNYGGMFPPAVSSTKSNKTPVPSSTKKSHNFSAKRMMSGIRAGNESSRYTSLEKNKILDAIRQKVPSLSIVPINGLNQHMINKSRFPGQPR